MSAGHGIDKPRRRSLFGRLSRHTPDTEVGLSPTGPSVKLGRTDASREGEALRLLAKQMSRRTLLSNSLAMEVEGETVESAEAMREEIHEARSKLPEGSSWDAMLETFEDACNTYRDSLRTNHIFGEELLALRAAAHKVADQIVEVFDFDEARRLCEKIDLESAINPMGETLAVLHVAPPGEPATPESHHQSKPPTLRALNREIRRGLEIVADAEAVADARHRPFSRPDVMVEYTLPRREEEWTDAVEALLDEHPVSDRFSQAIGLAHSNQLAAVANRVRARVEVLESFRKQLREPDGPN